MKRMCVRCNKKRDETKFVSSRGKVCATCRRDAQRAQARATHLKNTYGITVQEYEAIAAFGCNICGGERPYNLHVDHDHAIETLFGVRASVRGALCKRCNKLLRDVNDDPMLLRSALEYLANPPAKKVLFP